MNDRIIRFLYGTLPGRCLLKLVINARLDRLIVCFLRSRWSRPMIPRYVRRHKIQMDTAELRCYDTFRDFFARNQSQSSIDYAPEHLISPCDGWLKAYRIEEDSSFTIKGTSYRLSDLLEDAILAKYYEGGTCLIFRLCASDIHHYCYIDDGYQWQNQYIPGVLHSIQPIACETYPVYTLNRRCWCLMVTENFGPVVQTEVGALAVGGIVNTCENGRVCRGDEKGHFELAGSSIVLLFEPNRIRLISDVQRESNEGREVRVRQGMCIGYRKDRESSSV